MNSKSTQIWATLRHLTLVCVVVVGVLSILATGGSSGGGGGGGGVSPAVANLAGTWFGTLNRAGDLRSLSVTFDGSGNLTQELFGGVDTGRTGTIIQTSEGIFSFVLSDGTVGGFMLDAAFGVHAAYLDEFFSFGAVTKNATPVLPIHGSSDIVGTWSGFVVAVDSAFNIVQTATSNLTVASDLSFTETNSSSGTTTGGFTVIGANFGFFSGNFTSSSITGAIEAYLSTRNTFLAVVTCDTTDGSFLGGFPVDCSFFIYNLVLP